SLSLTLSLSLSLSLSYSLSHIIRLLPAANFASIRPELVAHLYRSFDTYLRSASGIRPYFTPLARAAAGAFPLQLLSVTQSRTCCSDRSSRGPPAKRQALSIAPTEENIQQLN